MKKSKACKNLSKHLRVLLIEDDEDDYVAVRNTLAEILSQSFALDWVKDYDSGVEALSRREYDVCLLDFFLGERSGLDMLQDLVQRGCETPIILLTGQGDYELDVEAMEAGAADFLHKGRITPDLLERSIRYSIARKHTEMELKRRRNHLQELVYEGTAEHKQTNETLQRQFAAHKRDADALRRSEELFRSLFENMLNGFAHCRMLFDGDRPIDFIYLNVNKAFSSMTGLNDVIDKKVSEVIPGIVESNPELIERYGRVALTGEPEQFETYIKSLGMWFSISVYSPQKEHFVAVFDVITERKQAEEERMRLAAAIEQASEAICITDTNWLIRYVNPAFCNMSGYDRSEVIGQHIRIINSHKHDKAFYRNIWKTLSRGATWSGRLTDRKKDGALYEVQGTASPVRDASGAIINYVTIHRDITHQVRLEAELHQAQKMEAIGLLAGGIAHDFNNILAAIMGFTELSLLKTQEDSLRSNLKQILTAASRASGIVKQILAFTRQGMQERKPVRISPIVQEALKFLRSSLPSTIEIRQEINVSPGQDIVLADPGQIHQVLMNLATNACHAMRAKGGTLSVKLSAITDRSLLQVHPDLKAGPYVCIAVSDTGHGMDSSVLERIFDPYFTTKKLGEGTGLGLSVVKGIVESHGGKITVTSEFGAGSSFHVLLPKIAEMASPKPPATEKLPTGSERILLVDDEKPLVDLGAEILKSLGYKVTAKTSSLEVLQIFRSQPDSFDLVISDMTMPELTGRDLAKELLAIRPDIPVVLCSGFMDQIDEGQAEAAGIRAFIMKPYSVVTLAKTIRRVLEEH